MGLSLAQNNKMHACLGVPRPRVTCSWKAVDCPFLLLNYYYETKGNYKILGKLPECKQKDCFQGHLFGVLKRYTTFSQKGRASVEWTACWETRYPWCLVLTHQRLCCAVPSHTMRHWCLSHSAEYRVVLSGMTKLVCSHTIQWLLSYWEHSCLAQGKK